MTDVWQISENFNRTHVARRFNSLDAVFEYPGEIVSHDKICSVKRAIIDGDAYYVKLYTAAGKRLRRYFGKSRLQREWENFNRFKVLGIPTAEIVGFGIETRFGIFRRGALITKGIERSIDLQRLAMEYPTRIRDRQWVVPIVEKVARYTRAMHDARFIHKDLNWRNILIDDREPPGIFFIDCPSGVFRSPPFLKRLIVRDLAHLDKLARKFLPKTIQLRFYLSYMNTDKLTENDKKFIKHIVNFHNKHRRRKFRHSRSSQTANTATKAKTWP